MIRSLLILALLGFASCKQHHTTVIVDPVPGVDGQDGLDGLNGLGFAFVRGIDGNEIVGDFWYGSAEFVVPEQILAIAPADDPRHIEGVILYLGGPFRYYLIGDRLAIVELSVLSALDLLDNIAGEGTLVELEGSETIIVKKPNVRIGDLRILVD